MGRIVWTRMGNMVLACLSDSNCQAQHASARALDLALRSMRSVRSVSWILVKLAVLDSWKC